MGLPFVFLLIHPKISHGSRSLTIGLLLRYKKYSKLGDKIGSGGKVYQYEGFNYDSVFIFCLGRTIQVGNE